jgi:predicted lipoprotein with Yx(FWY)xxD motif
MDTDKEPGMTKRTHRTISMLAIGTLALTACGGDDDDATEDATEDTATDTTTDATPDATTPATTAADTTTPATPTTAAPTTATPATSAAPDATDAPMASGVVALADTELGQVIVDPEGFTLYMFVPDSEGVPTCTGPCAGSWPPYYAVGDAELTAAEGLDATLLSTVAHPDGGDMIKYGDWPLYYFAGDEAPGDVNGQGVNDVWYVVDATGAPVIN